MEEGRVVQQGTPDELYERPRNIYVAAKIGSPHMNLLETTASAGGGSLETPFGPMITRHRDIPTDEPIVMGIRPSDIKLARNGEPHIPAKVSLVEPLGDLTIVSLNAGESHLRMVLSEADAAGVRSGQGPAGRHRAGMRASVQKIRRRGNSRRGLDLTEKDHMGGNGS